MRLLACFVALTLPLSAQHALYACMAITKEYVVGAKLLPSGLFRRSNLGEWTHLGYNHPLVLATGQDARDPSVLYLAAGNGLIRAAANGVDWKILTGSDVTELRDLSVDPANDAIYFAYSAGIRTSRDHGATWRELSAGLHRKYAEAIRVDRAHSGTLLTGGEEGIYRSTDDGATWRLSGAAGFSIMRIEQSPHDSCFWLAATERGGLFASHDCGVTFESTGSLGVGRNLYDISFDPTSATRIAVAGWGPGVAVSSDTGKTWVSRNIGLPRPDVWSVAFDPDHPGRLYASVQEAAVYVSNNAGVNWTQDGLEGSVAYRLRFLPTGSNQ
jgi:photosystem II stability/assembly factor-like uncharacterized protein